jgi:putative MATE family efflux protein
VQGVSGSSPLASTRVKDTLRSVSFFFSTQVDAIAFEGCALRNLDTHLNAHAFALFIQNPARDLCKKCLLKSGQSPDIIKKQRVALMRNSGCMRLRVSFFDGRSANPMEHANQYLGTEPVGELMCRYAVPCIISLLVGALYNVVDQIFIANASYLGSYGNAANTVVFPLTVVALAVAVMVGDGCCAFVSISLGKGERDTARRSVGNAVVMSVAGGVVLTALYLLFQTQIISMFGGTVNEETFRYSQEYFFYITLGIPFYMFGQAMNPVIRADGSPKFAMVSTLAGAVTNIILDPIFIFVLQWGMMGAAVATVIGQVITAALAVWYLLHMKTIKPGRTDFTISSGVCGRTLLLGITSFLSQISLVAAMAAINNMLRRYGALDVIFGQPEYAQIPMAVVGIVMKFFQIVISVVVGMAAGCIPIVGFNMGAEKRTRVREVFTRLLAAEAAVGLLGFVLAEFFPRQLISIFGAANESVYYTQFALKAFRIYLCMIILACVNKACFIFLQAMGKAVQSTALSMIREVVFGVGFALALPLFFQLDGVLFSMPVSDVLTFLAALFLIRHTYGELREKGGQLQ